MQTEFCDIEKAILCAADHIEKEPEKWCRGYYTMGEAHCAVGWIQECMENSTDYVSDAEYELRWYFEENEMKMNEFIIIDFNDNEENDNIAVANFLRGLVKS